VDDYYPFGQSMESLSYKRFGGKGNDFKFTGVEEVADLGLNLHHTTFRFYDPALGRFTGIDALADAMTGINPYSYSFNNPINFNDPLGLMPEEADADGDGFVTPSEQWIFDNITSTDPERNNPGRETNPIVQKDNEGNFIRQSDLSSDQIVQQTIFEGGISLTTLTGKQYSIEFKKDEELLTIILGEDDIFGLSSQQTPTHPGQLNVKEATDSQIAVHLLKGIRFSLATGESINLNKLFSHFSNTELLNSGTHFTVDTSVKFGVNGSVPLYAEIPNHGPRSGLIFNPYEYQTNPYTSRWSIRWGKGQALLGILIAVPNKHSSTIKNYLGLD